VRERGHGFSASAKKRETLHAIRNATPSPAFPGRYITAFFCRSRPLSWPCIFSVDSLASGRPRAGFACTRARNDTLRLYTRVRLSSDIESRRGGVTAAHSSTPEVGANFGTR
jgi:hypothetical protein